jgi:2-polyprenyl-6-methoxyphenol hydroxylase-like FAD-dependent oxidoreductase
VTLHSIMNTAECTCLIVGGGPVGLTMAAHLHRHGIACRVVDRTPQPSQYSKALVLWPRTLEMLDALGIADDFARAGMFLNRARIHAGGRLLARIALELTDTRFPQALMLAQSETERLLIAHLERAGVTVERPVELTAFAEEGDHVRAILHHGDGRIETVRCDWLLGCDGAHSTVRREMGAVFTGHAEPNDWMLADCRVEGPVPQDELSLFWHSRGVLAFFPFAPGRCRVIADLGPAHGDGRPADPSLADVQAAVDERGPPGVRLSEPHWLSGFRINERMVADYQRGRVLLAGDAAHIHSPAGGQGMNTGMQDTWNLAWKLALVQQRAAPPSLLHSYGHERSRVGAMVLKNASRLTTLGTLRNPLTRGMRSALVRLVTGFAVFRRRFARTLSELDIHYPDSPLNGEANGRRWARSAPRPGDRLPDVRVRSAAGHEEWLLRLLRDPRHHLLLLPADGDPFSMHALLGIQAAVTAAYAHLIDVHVLDSTADALASVRRLLGARTTAIVLVRPDGYISYRAQPALWDGLRTHLEKYLLPKSGS